MSFVRLRPRGGAAIVRTTAPAGSRTTASAACVFQWSVPSAPWSMTPGAMPSIGVVFSRPQTSVTSVTPGKSVIDVCVWGVSAASW